jgi:hypothetical protein
MADYGHRASIGFGAASMASASSAAMSVRPATESDLDEIVALAYAYRDRLAAWESWGLELCAVVSL